MAKKKYEKITSPIGRANYPYLNTPDTKFKEEGEYKVDLILDKVEDAQFLGALKARAEKAFEAAKVDLKKKNKHGQVKNLQPYVPYEELYDNEGNTTGEVKVKLKTKALIKRSDGSSFELKPDLFDSAGKPLDREEVIIYSGSKIRANFTPAPFYSAAINKAGISLRLNAVQVIELSEGNSASADNYGFGVVDDGFTADEADFGNSESSSDEGSDAGNYNFEGGDF